MESFGSRADTEKIFLKIYDSLEHFFFGNPLFTNLIINLRFRKKFLKKNDSEKYLDYFAESLKK